MKESGMISEHKIFRDIDRHFALFVKQMGGSGVSVMTALLLSKELEEKHVCVELTENNPRLLAYAKEGIPLMSVDEWQRKLKADSATVGKPGEYKPLIYDNGRIYLQKYWAYEERVSSRVAEMARETDKINTDCLKDLLAACSLEKKRENVSGLPVNEREDLQTAAVMMALQSRICVISGGPGTGKTAVLARILAILLGLDSELKIGLAAPTGKAAMRMNESIRTVVEKFTISRDLKEKVVQNKAVTLHRLLGDNIRLKSGKYDECTPLTYDIVFVDEASMIDLALMATLLSSLKQDSKLILLGDKHQLSSVEAGSVLADICEALGTNRFSKKFTEKVNQVIPDLRKHLLPLETQVETMTDKVVHLKRNYRFESGRGIGSVCRKIEENQNGESIAEDLLSHRNNDSIATRGSDKPDFGFWLNSKTVVARYRTFLDSNDPQTALDALNDFKILTPLNSGPFGVVEINRRIEQILEVAGHIAKEREFYIKRPVIIRKNDYTMGLFNGDTGVVMPYNKTGVRVFFRDAQGIKGYSPNLLPNHETAFSLTVHRSQGSEFKNVLFLIPDREVPLVTRELVYTAISRAREHVEVVGRKDILAAALNRKTLRSSGLRNMIKQKLRYR